MSNNTEKVVKCGQCDKYFGHSETNTKCPFCHTEYEEKIAEKPREKKLTVKTQKESFKIWKE